MATIVSFLSFQAHMQARYVILRVLLEAGKGLVELTSFKGSDGKPDILIKLDREKIESVGRPAIGNFLRKLQVSVYFIHFPTGQIAYTPGVLVFRARENWVLLSKKIEDWEMQMWPSQPVNPVTRHFNLQDGNHSKHHMATCGLSLYLGTSEIRKNLEQKCFQSRTLFINLLFLLFTLPRNRQQRSSTFSI